MRSSTTAYALAAQFLPFVLAVPVAQVVNIVTEVDVVTAFTQVETYVDATTVDAAPVVTSVVVETPASSAAVVSHFGHHDLHSAPSYTDGFPSAFSPFSIPVVPSSSTTPAVVVPTVAPTTTPAVTPTVVPTPSTVAIPTTTSTPAPAPPAYTPTTTSTAAPVPTPTSYVSTGDYSFMGTNLQSVAVNSTNFYRSMFQAPALAWNESLVAQAQSSASTCNFADNTGGVSEGQNIAATFVNAPDAFDTWGNEYKLYPWNDPGFYESTGHFTQVVWQSTTSIGCGSMKCPGDGSTSAAGWYLVCNYYPPGNISPEYPANVLPEV